MAQKSPADRTVAARFAPLFALPTILAASSATSSDVGWGDAATLWGILVGVTVALVAAGIGYAVTQRR